MNAVSHRLEPLFSTTNGAAAVYRRVRHVPCVPSGGHVHGVAQFYVYRTRLRYVYGIDAIGTSWS